MGSPFFKLYERQPNYTFLRIFGCRCFPYLIKYDTNKFSKKTYPCIFIRYSSNHMGYRCLDPVSIKVYISRHVVFDELCFPFNKNINKNDVLQPTIPKMTTFPYMSQWSKETKETNHQSSKENMTISN